MIKRKQKLWGAESGKSNSAESGKVVSIPGNYYFLESGITESAGSVVNTNWPTTTIGLQLVISPAVFKRSRL